MLSKRLISRSLPFGTAIPDLAGGRNQRQKQMGFTKVNVVGDRPHKWQMVYSPRPQSGEKVILISYNQLHAMAFLKYI